MKLTERLVINTYPHRVDSIKFHSQGKLIAGSGIVNKGFKIWDLETEETIVSVKSKFDEYLHFDLSPNGKLLATPKENGIRIWDLNSKKNIININIGNYHDIAFSNNGHILASCDGHNEVSLWQVSTGIKIKTLTPSSQEDYVEFYGVKFKPNDNIIASYGYDGYCTKGTIKLWNALTGERVGTIWTHEGDPTQVEKIIFSPKGSIIASFSNSLRNDREIIQLWKVNSGNKISNIWGYRSEKIATLVGHTNKVRDFCFHPGETILASTDECEIKFWELKTQQEIYNIDVSQENITSVAFSPDGKLLIGIGQGRLVDYRYSSRIVKVWHGDLPHVFSNQIISVNRKFNFHE